MKYIFRSIVPAIIFLSTGFALHAQTVIPLYNGKIPNSKPSSDEEVSKYEADSILVISKISRPTLTIFQAPKEKATGAAVVICPGGGYWVTASKHEGTDVAKRFNRMGVTAFVLKYRIPSEKTMLNKEIGHLQDAQRALQYVRENSKKYGVDKKRVGILGFSAGGHLASTAATHYQKAYIPNPKKTSLRPDFMVLIYPVVSFQDSISHSGSGEQLLGKNALPEKLREYSNELQVTSNTPPTFLVHAKDDQVKVQNSIVFHNALDKKKVPNEMYLYEKGGHGYGMFNKSSSVLWPDLVEQWLIKMKFIKK